MLHLFRYILIASLIVGAGLFSISACVDTPRMAIFNTLDARAMTLLNKECADAEIAMKYGMYSDVRRALGNARAIARVHGLTIPESTASLGVPSAEMRMSEIESEMRVAYHEYDLREVSRLGSEAVQLAKEESVSIPERIVQITTKMARGYLEPFYQGKPVFGTKPMDT